MTASVLVVEDEADIGNTLVYNLERAGIEANHVLDGRSALDALSQDRLPDLVILDLMLPDLSGTEICRHIRMTDRTKHLPVLMLTAKGEEIDRVVGFEIGADDYVTKPFSVRELMLRVQAILRRSHASTAETPDQTFGLLRIDAEGHRAWVDGAEISLTALEFRLLDTLLKRRGRVQTRDMLLEDVWDVSGDLTTRTVDTHVKRLRQKLGVASHYIETLRGVGYRFRAEPGG